MTDDTRVQQALDRLAADIQKFQILYSRYLAGDLPQPPTDFRDELHARISNLRSAPRQSTAGKFRLQSLTARFASYNELFERKAGHRRARVQAERRPGEAVVFGSHRGGDAVRCLYTELYKESGDRTSMSGFRGFLEKKVTEIRERTGCSSVQFRVVEQDGKRSLKAKPIGRPKRPATVTT